MAFFVVSRATPLTAESCWDRLTDWPRHGDSTPLTRVHVVTGSGRAAGDVIAARTALCGLGFDDPMELVVFAPPADGRDGLCRLEKRGRLVHGWAELRVSARPWGAQAEWAEELRVRHVPAAANPMVARVARLVFGRTLAALLS